MNKQQQNWLHVLFIAIAIIGLLINVGIVFLIGVILEIWHLWRIYQAKKPGSSSKSARGHEHKVQGSAEHKAQDHHAHEPKAKEHHSHEQKAQAHHQHDEDHHHEHKDDHHDEKK